MKDAQKLEVVTTNTTIIMVSPVVAIVTITIIGTRAFLPQTSCSFQYIVLPWCLEQSQYPLNVPKIPVDGLTGCNLSFQIYKGEPKNLEFIYEKLCIYSYMFTLQSPSKWSPSDAIHLLMFFPLLKTVFESVDFDAF